MSDKKNRFSKKIAYLLIVVMFFQISMPAYALTEGPSQPEFNSFTPIGTSDMVDLATGDFNYNIPIMDVGGYPINLSYNSGVTMDQEASWVGLGWNLNVGQINREVRGIPDDFKGDTLTSENNVKTNFTVAVNPYVNFQLIGAFDNLPVNLGSGLNIRYNNYDGVSVTPSFGLSFQLSDNVTVGMDLSSSTTEGVSISPRAGLHSKMEKFSSSATTMNAGFSAGISYNSRQGLESFNLSSSVGYKNDTEKRFNTLSRSGSGSLSFLNQTFTPVKRLAYKNISGTAAVSLGPDVFGGHAEGTISASVNIQKLKNKTQKNKAYGYEHTELAGDNDILDFNREKEKSTVSQNTTVLPVTNYTYDVYTIQGQGIGGSFKAFKSQVGQVYDARVTDDSESYSLGVEIEGGAGAHIGGNFKTNHSNTYTGRWDTNVASFFKESKNGNDFNYEREYFKKSGLDGSGADIEYAGLFESKLGGAAPIALKLGGSKQPEAKYLKKNEVSSSTGYQNVAITTPIKRQQRVMRNQLIQKFTGKEVDSFKVSGNTYSPKLLNHFIKPNKNGQSHHTAGYIITDEYGNRHVYGESVYNKEKLEVSFSVGSKPKDSNKDNELVIYSPGNDNSTGNSKGKDNFFNRETTPAYAHTYLISSILDVDYEDLTGDGPSDDDLGGYTQFFYDSKDDYKWRVPYGQNMASFNNGLATNTTDQKGSYLYGEKEIKYLHRVVTKTHIAYFDLDKRKDGYGVLGENGGGSLSSSAPMYKIKSIRLYSKPELIAAGVNLETGPLDNSIKPIKTAHFRYNYDLCKGVDNNLGDNNMLESEIGENNGGKLTLKKVYFTYRNSNMGMYTPYEFEYHNENDNNASYNIKNYDIWGNYKKRKTNSYYDNDSGAPTPQEFPYVEQFDKEEQDNLASVWSLKTIILPSKGKISIGYESDDYQYVQDRRAMRMYMVEGVSLNATIGGINSQLYSSLGSDSRYIVIKLDPSDTETTANNFKERYIGDQISKPIFFNFLLNTVNGKYDHVEGYFKIDPNRDVELKSSGSDRYLFIPMQFLDMEGGITAGQQVNPISKAGWYFVRQYLNLEIGTGQSYNSFNVVEIAKSLVSSIGNVVEVFTGPNKKLRYKGVAGSFKENKSWIRLLEPTGSKLGGGVRVKNIELYDSWEGMTNIVGDIGRYKKRYGQEYKYILEDGTSSGVASYEPNFSKENPFVEPFYDKNDRLVAPREVNYTEKPFGESFFPSPVVTYSRVEVKNISADTGEGSASVSVTGRVITEHYTFKDFPVITDHTELNNDLMKFTSNQDQAVSNMLKGMLGLKVETKSDLVISQGFYIETNDMNGKLKKQSVYDHGGSLISSIEHKYKVKEGYPDRLENTVPVLDRNGNISEKVLGVHYDVINDFRKSYSEMNSFGVNLNTDLIPLGFIPIIIGFGVPEKAEHIQELKTVVTTKVVHRSGLLEETIAFDLGSVVKTKNIAWDQDTGYVILTETNNEYDDNYYSFNYPAYWYKGFQLYPNTHWYWLEANNYDRMGHSSKNIDIKGTLHHIENGFFMIQGHFGDDLSNYFTFGDEILMDDRFILWVYAFSEDFKEVLLMDREGKFFDHEFPPVPQSHPFRIIRSGNRNNLKEFMASVTSMVNPIDPDNDGELQSFNSETYQGESWKVVNASAVQYSDIWRFFCQGALYDIINEGDNRESEYELEFAGWTNPYVNNFLGNFRAQKSYAYLAGRNYTEESNTRNSGFYKNFSPFYKLTDSVPSWTKNGTDWTFASGVSLYYPHGMEAENIDALGRYSSALYGHRYTLPIAVTSNSRYQYMGFDGLEDYDFATYDYPIHFGFSNYYDHKDSVYVSFNPFLTDEHSHTGNYSIKVPADTSLRNRKAHKNGCMCYSMGLKDGDYILSAWVKEVSDDGRQFKNYRNSKIRVEGFVTEYLFGELYPSGPIINGWQKIEGIVNIKDSKLDPDSKLKYIDFYFENFTTEISTVSYFDDIRLHPIESNMKSFAYDKKTQLLMAELDENNFATFYEYDKEGGLIRVKKETEKGIFTIQETRSNTTKR